MRLLLVPALLAVATGCADYSAAEYDDASDTGFRDSATDTNGDSGDDVPAEPAEFWTLDGTLVVSGGALDVDASTLLVDLWRDGASVCEARASSDTAADTGGTDADDEVFPTEPEVAFAEASTPPDDPALLAWWDLTLAEGAIPCTAPLPVTSVGLGLGPMDARLYPALEHDGVADAEAAGATLYGAYLRAGAGDLWVFGVAGTEGQLAGTEPVATEAPLPDGTYALRSLFLLPVP